MPLIGRRGVLALAVGMVFAATAPTAASPSAAESPPTKQECVAANEGGQDLRQSGRLQEARAKFAVCIATSCPHAVREDCAQRLAELAAVMPTLVLAAKDGAGKDLFAVDVTMDGRPLVQTLDGTPVAVDPGEHRLEFEVPGEPTVQETIVVREGDRDRRVEVTLGTVSTLAAKAPPQGLRWQRSVGLGLAGVGAVGIVTGTVFGLIAKSTYDHAFGPLCGNDADNCTAQGASDGQTAHTQALVSTVAFAVGATLLAAGATFYFAAPRSSGAAVGVSLGVGSAVLGVHGAW